MTYKSFSSDINGYTQDISSKIPNPEHQEETYLNKPIHLLDSDNIQMNLDLIRAENGVSGKPFDEAAEKRKLIAQTVGNLTEEASAEFKKFQKNYQAMDDAGKKGMLDNCAAFYEHGMKAGNPFENIKTQEDFLKDVTGENDLSKLSDAEKVIALTAGQKTMWRMEIQNLRNTDYTYNFFVVENKSANPLGYYKSRIDSLPEETRKTLKENHADKLMDATHYGAAYHEMTHALGTEDERKCESFRFLKTLQKFDPELLYPDVNARLGVIVNVLETIRREEIANNRTPAGNFTYLMPNLLLNVLENSEALKKKAASASSEKDIMAQAKGLVSEASYAEEAKKDFREMAKECKTPEAFAKKLQEIYKSQKPETIYKILDDCVKVQLFITNSRDDFEKKAGNQEIKEAIAGKMFSIEKLKSPESRNIGKEDVSKVGLGSLTKEEKAFYKNVYQTCRDKNPDVSGKQFDVLFAKEIVRANWDKKAGLEAQLENPAKAKEILFNEANAAKMTADINRCLAGAHHSSEIVKDYSAEFEKAYAKEKTKPSLMKQLQPKGSALMGKLPKTTEKPSAESKPEKRETSVAKQARLNNQKNR